MIKLDLTKAIVKEEMSNLEPYIKIAHELLHQKKGTGSEYTGWVEWPIEYDKEEYARVKTAAEKIRKSSDVLIVIGIGGSYLGAKAAIELLSHSFYNQLNKEDRKGPEIYFIGQNISSTYMSHLLELIEGKDVSVNVISKSGTTTEPALAFRLMRKWLEDKYGEDGAKERIFATTDKEKGALRTLAENEGYETFVIPDDIGGRYSILTAVGLLPIAVSGADLDSIMLGARDAYHEYQSEDIDSNACYQYALARNVLYNKGKSIELFVSYEPSFQYVAEWWKQLFGESEGKDNKGIFPASVIFTTDLHSMGQYIQDGRRDLFETVLQIEKPKVDIEIELEAENSDGLNYLAGKTINYVNKKAFEGTVLAHQDGGAPNIIVTLPEMNEYYFGKLIYFFEKACAISGYLMGINPFDQPGVEAYKRNMFALLGKPGYENLKKELENRLNTK